MSNIWITDELRDDFNEGATVYELSWAEQLIVSDNLFLFINNQEQIWWA